MGCLKRIECIYACRHACRQRDSVTLMGLNELHAEPRAQVLKSKRKLKPTKHHCTYRSRSPSSSTICFASPGNSVNLRIGIFVAPTKCPMSASYQFLQSMTKGVLTVEGAGSLASLREGASALCHSSGERCFPPPSGVNFAGSTPSIIISLHGLTHRCENVDLSP